MELKKPFIAMNLSQEDWETLMGYPSDYDRYYADDILTDPLDRERYILMSTKPKWA